ncbi:hypothetical protein EZV62_018329 [Acer yangbiense]|uniref:CCHC-type domain-containing protein n=1 Tax=Acer yangbiense TaxID=1000413 RepID=A0A5C7HL93_9ROSI|nr:hypothetical protein EZV62_018329 [Acer yangbiense]
MNAEDIALLCSGLSIQEKERQVLTLEGKLKDKGEQRLAFCLVGKVLSTKMVNKNVFIEVMNKIWSVEGGVEIDQIKGNTFEFLFKSLKARQRVLNGGPWSFDRVIIVFEKPTGNLIGEVRELDLETNLDGFGRFLCVRVTVQVEEPLQQSIRVDLMGEGKITTLLLRYERLMDFCFICNRLGHVMGECTDTKAKGTTLADANRKLVGLGGTKTDYGDNRRNYDNWRSRIHLLKEANSGDREGLVSNLLGAHEKEKELECMKRNKHISQITVGSISGGVDLSGTKSVHGGTPQDQALMEEEVLGDDKHQVLMEEDIMREREIGQKSGSADLVSNGPMGSPDSTQQAHLVTGEEVNISSPTGSTHLDIKGELSGPLSKTQEFGSVTYQVQNKKAKFTTQNLGRWKRVGKETNNVR